MIRRRDVFASLTVLALVHSAGCTAFKRFTYEGFNRDPWQHPQEVIRALAIQPGERVADIGAGGGYFTFRLADAVGPEGKVYAVDVDQGMIDYLAERAAKEGRGNVETILAAPDDPRLPEDGVDLIFTCNTYHHLEDRPAYFAGAKRYLRANGRVAIVDFSERSFWERIIGHATPSDLIRNEMQAAGYQLQQEHTFLPDQSFLVFATDGR